MAIERVKNPEQDRIDKVYIVTLLKECRKIRRCCSLKSISDNQMIITALIAYRNRKQTRIKRKIKKLGSGL